MTNAVIYARYSSHGQNEQTIEGQVRVCREYATRQKLNIVNIYVDKHKTGTDDNRPEFQRMIKDSASGAFDCIIVYMLDRFARSRYFSTIYNFKLSTNNVKLLSATENISESEEGEFYQMFLEWNNEKYSRRLSKRVIEGLTTSVNNGTYAGGHLIYGYNILDNRVVLDDTASAAVKFIFEQYVAGIPKSTIAEELNKQGLRWGNKLWAARNLDRILINEKYTGVYYFGGRLCENTYPAIVSREVFDAAQKRAAANKHFSGANGAKEPYLLQGKIYCGKCGAPMVADGGTSKTGVQYHYYACTAKKKKHTCSKKNEKKDFLEWYAVEQTVNYLNDPRRVAIIADDVLNYYANRTTGSEIRRVISEKTKTQKEIDNALDTMLHTKNIPTIQALDNKIAELSTLIYDLNAHQTKLELESGLKVTKADIIAFVDEFCKGNLHDKEFQKRIINNLINAFYIYDDKVVIYFNIHGGKETAFIGIDDTNEAASADTQTHAKVQTLPHSLRHE